MESVLKDTQPRLAHFYNSLSAFASWSGQDVGRKPHLIPLKSLISSSFFLPFASAATPWVLPLQPPVNLMFDTISFSSTSKVIFIEHTPFGEYV